MSRRPSVSETMVEAAGLIPPGHSHSHNTCTAEPSHACHVTALPTSPHGRGRGEKKKGVHEEVKMRNLTPSYEHGSTGAEMVLF